MPSDFSYPKSARLLRRREYLVMNAGRQDKIRLSGFMAVCRRNGLDRDRLGVTTTKKVGSAVVRNRLKRAAREFFRLRRGEWPRGFDLLLIALRPDGRDGSGRPEKGVDRPTLSPDDERRLRRFLERIAASSMDGRRPTESEDAPARSGAPNSRPGGSR
jgi:ribonuclease P protein component